MNKHTQLRPGLQRQRKTLGLRAAGRVEFSQVGKWRWQGCPEEDPPVQDIPPGGAVPALHRTE